MNGPKSGRFSKRPYMGQFTGSNFETASSSMPSRCIEGLKPAAGWKACPTTIFSGNISPREVGEGRIVTKSLWLLILTGFAIALFAGPAGAETFHVNGAVLAGIQLPIPENNAEKEYLGLSGNGTFSLSQLKAAALIIEVFSMYCPHCQREAPVVNKLHGLIGKDASLTKDVKLVGIGIGNTPFEVEVFRKEFRVLFPLFPDDSYQLQKVSKNRFRTPTFIVAQVGPRGDIKIRDVHVGPIKDLDKYLDNVKKLTVGK